MKIYFLCFIFLFSCGRVDLTNSLKDNTDDTANEDTLDYESLKANSLLYYDFKAYDANFINMNNTNLLESGFNSLSLNQNGETEEYIQTNLDIRTVNQATISIWFTSEDINAIQTLIWQGISSQNGWGNSSGSSVTTSEMNININHFSNTDGNSISAFYGYDDQLTNPSAVNFPYNPDGSLNGSTEQLYNNVWYHLVVTLEKVDNKIYLKTYLNGELQNEGEGTQFDSSSWDSDFRIGRPGANTRYFVGEITNVLVSEEKLSDLQIKELYELGIL